jgi:hypothetical protein
MVAWPLIITTTAALGSACAQPSQRLDAVDAGHLHVEKDQMRAEAVVLAQPIESARHGLHRVAFVLEQLPERLANAGSSSMTRMRRGSTAAVTGSPARRGTP